MLKTSKKVLSVVLALGFGVKHVDSMLLCGF